MSEAGGPYEELARLIDRRQLLTRASALGLAALVGAALPAARAAQAKADLTLSSLPTDPDATLQAFADTMLPGRKATRTDLGNPIDPRAIAGVDPLPGAVETDALALYHNAEVGFNDLEPAFLADLESRALLQGGPFLELDFDRRVKACLSGLSFNNPTLLVWDAAAAVPFTAFCAAALIRNATWNDASGYRVMGLPGTAPNGYRGFSYRRRLSRERTRTGSLR